jgi:hypothetical protein
MGLPYKHKLPIPNAFIFREQALTTPRPGIFSVLWDRIVANGKRSRFPVTGNYRDSENIPTVDGIP